ncbi:hypothetical protein STEG23_036415, partial [Scotinomys teguina]
DFPPPPPPPLDDPGTLPPGPGHFPPPPSLDEGAFKVQISSEPLKFFDTKGKQFVRCGTCNRKSWGKTLEERRSSLDAEIDSLTSILADLECSSPYKPGPTGNRPMGSMNGILRGSEEALDAEEKPDLG